MAGGGGTGSIGQTLRVLRNRNVFPYLIGNMLSSTGTWFQSLAQAILIYRLTHSTFLLGVIGFSQYAAVFVFAPIAGGVADRFDRRRVLMASQAFAFGVTALLTVITATGHATPTVLITLALVLGCSNAFSNPTMMSFVPSLVEEQFLATALALNSVTFNIGRAIGPILAAVIINTLGPTWAFGMNSVSYLALIGGLLLVRPLRVTPKPKERPRLLEAVKLVARDKRLLFLLYVIAAINLATDPAITLGPAFITKVFHHRDSLAGLLVGAFGAGAVLAAFTVAHKLHGSRRVLTAALLCSGFGIAGFAVSPVLPVALALLVVMGFGYLAANTAATSRLQLEVADEQRGRVMALWSIAFLGVRPIGSLLDGAVASFAGVRIAAVLMAVPALAGAAALIVLLPRLRRQGASS